MSQPKTQGKRAFSNRPLPEALEDFDAARAGDHDGPAHPDSPGPLEDPHFEAGHGGRWRTFAGCDLRPSVVEEYAHLVYLELAGNALRDAVRMDDFELPSDRELKRRAQEIVTSHVFTRADFAAMDQFKPQSLWRDEIDGIPHEIRIGALLLRSQYAFLYRYMMRKTGGRGPAPAKMKVAAALLLQAWSTEPKAIDTVRLNHWETNAQRAHVFQYPKDDPAGTAPSSKPGFWESFVNLIDDVDIRVLQHVMVEVYFEFCREAGIDPEDDLVLVPDGSFTEASMRQGPPADEEHRRIRQRSLARVRAAYRSYGNKGVFRKSVMGYKLVVLVSMRTGRPVIACVVGSDEEERDAVLYLVRRLREIKPDHHFEYLCGDGIYGWGRKWLRTMMFAEALIPVTQWRNDYDAMFDGTVNDRKHYDRGTPICGCGMPMRRAQWQGVWWSPKRRLTTVDDDGRRVLPRGKMDPNAKRLKQRFECVAGRCPNKVTYPWRHPGVFSPLPHARPGRNADSKWHSMRVAMLLYRNVVESVYSSIQRLGLQGRDGQRPAWATDHGMHVLLMLGLIFLTGRRLINLSDGYDTDSELPDPSSGRVERNSTLGRYLAQLETLELREEVGAGEQAGPDPETLIAALDAQALWTSPPAPPATLLREVGADLADLRGSSTFDVRAAALKRLRASRPD